MDEAQRLWIKRRGLKGSVTKLLAKANDILSVELETVNLNSTSQARRLLASTTVTQLTAKKGQIERLDDTIADAIQEEEELETEVCEADTYQTTLEEHIAFLEEFVKRAIRPPQPTLHELPDESRESTSLISNTPTHEPEVVSKPIHSTATIAAAHESNETARTDSTYQNYSRLPKLALPTFSGDPLQW